MKNRYWKFGSIAALAIVLTAVVQPAHAKLVTVGVDMSHPVIPANQTTTAYVEISLTGATMPRTLERPPVNLAIVLDKSGSMSGAKIQEARNAAIAAVNMLAPDDIVSIVTYDSTVSVIVPATKASDRAAIIGAIQQIQPGGSTALFGGVSKGAHEVRKFFQANRVNRIILLSDGLANQGPSSPAELGALGRSLGSEGITVSTIGLGLDYNEDLMTQLALNSDGNHMFAENATDVARAFQRELGDALSVVAQDIEIEFVCGTGVRPVRVLGRDAEISGNRMRMSMNQLYAEQKKFIVLEVEVPATESSVNRAIGRARVNFTDMQTQDETAQIIDKSVLASANLMDVDKSQNSDIMASVVYMQALENNRRALALRDAGEKEEAKKVLESNVVLLEGAATKYDSDQLKDYAVSNDFQVEQFDQPEAEFKRTRKIIRKEQHEIQTQQKVAPKR